MTMNVTNSAELAQALALPNVTMIVMADGIYPMAGSPLKLSKTIRAAAGARPIITALEGTSPYIEVQNGATIDGLWFGGTKQISDAPFVIKNDTTIRNCTLWNYYGGIVEGGGARNTIQGCRFVECGTASLYHAIYISNGAADHWTVIEDNIFIGGEGYSTHLWHLPSNVTLRRNFYGDVQWMVVINGLGHTMTDTVMWSNRGIPSALLGCNYSGTPGDDTTSFDVQHNMTGAQTQRTYCTTDPVRVCHDNTFYIGVPQTYGDNPHVVSSVPGIDSAALDSAIAALRSAFLQSVSTIHADTNIEINFATCADAVAIWGGQP